MRVIVALEGVKTVDGRLIKRGGLTLPEEPVPVTVAPASAFDTSTLWGKATDFRRWCGYIITAQVEGSTPFPMGLSPNLDVLDTSMTVHKDETLEVESGRIMGLHFGTSAWEELQ